jgi:heat-inducible transcriptional repressor
MMKENERSILFLVIDLFVSDGVPVSSHKVKDTAGLSVSTATIRNLMASLERKGYLTKPHTSAGRIPTDEGYRCFVDFLMSRRPSNVEFSRAFRRNLLEEATEISSIMAFASRYLGSMTKNFAVVYGSVLQESRINRINLLELEGSRLLVVVHLTPEYERTTTLRLEKKFSPEIISRAESLINRVVGGKAIEEAKEALDSIIRDNVTGEGIITREVAVKRESIFYQPPAVELYFEEREHLLQQPDVFDPSLLQLLLRLLHDKAYLTSILSRRMEERTHITIGCENEDDILKHFSFVTSGYRMGGARGVLGIIGPTRMHYDYTLNLVDAIAKELRAIGEEYF